MKKDLISKLNKRVDIQQKVKIDDNSGGFNEEWVLLRRVWAAIEPIVAFESFVADRNESRATHTITIRYTASINPCHRIKYGNRIFWIRGIINSMEKNRTMELRTEEQQQ